GRAAREQARERLHRLAERGERRELRLELRPLVDRVRGQALVERRDDDAVLASELPPKRRRNRHPPLPVDPVPISPFEHSSLGVFHTFFHFSTQAIPRSPSRRAKRGFEGSLAISSAGCFVALQLARGSSRGMVLGTRPRLLPCSRGCGAPPRTPVGCPSL